eukprot:gene18635-25148_t
MNKAGGVSMGRKVAAPTVSAPRTVTRAQGDKGALGKLSDSVGMPTGGGIFGFTPFAEQWVGRWAMLGFSASCVGEFTTGKGALGQVGLETPSTEILLVLTALLIGGSVIGSATTGKKVLDKDMSDSEVSRYKNFLGLGSPEEEKRTMQDKVPVTMEGTSMKATGTADASSSAPKDASYASMEATTTEEADAVTSAPSVTPTESWGEKKDMYPGETNDMAFARTVEITNGRWAMMGFFASIMVEAATGSGIFGQLIIYLKASGVLGAKSGF